MKLNFSRKTHVTEEEILSAIAWGATTARAICDYTSSAERAVDRALQRARRKGLIAFAGRAWSIVDAAPEPEDETVVRLRAENERLSKLVSDILDLVEDSRRGFHDSTVWEDEEYVGDYSDIAKRWADVRDRASTPPISDSQTKGTDHG